jgi:hypothetical protein
MERRFRKPSATAGRVGTEGPRRRFAIEWSCRWLAVQSLVTLTAAIGGGRDVGGGEAVPPRPARVDPAVAPAGGARAAHADCRECRRAACPQCRLAAERHPGHGPCQHGLCPAHCPVRPDVFGFYGTQWRRWPSANVIQVSNDEAATPARPPRSIVPAPLEESLEPAADPQPLPAPAADMPPARPMPPRDVDVDAGREQGRALGRELGRETGRPASDAARPAAPPQPAPASPPADPREATGNDAADDKSEPAAKPAAEKPAEQPDAAPERLFNLDERPQAAPWRSFTAKARLEARERR